MAMLDSELLILVLRLSFLALVYLFLLQVVFTIRRDLHRAAPEQARSGRIGQLAVLDSSDPSLTAGQIIALQQETTIGRAPHNSIVINDGFVSASHAVLTYEDKHWHLADTGSTNGTYVNRKRIAERTPVNVGDVVEVGQVKFKLVR